MSLSVPYAAMEPVVYTRYKHHSRDFLWRERRIQTVRQPRLLGTTTTVATVILTKARTVFVGNYHGTHGG